MRRLALSLLTLSGAVLAGTGAASAAAGPPPSPAFPVTVHAANGAITFKKAPERIMSLSPSATEMLYADGAGHQVVAVDKYSTVPPDAPRTSFTGFEASAEDYVRYRPDLVVLAFDENGLVHQLALLHIPVLLMPPATSLAASYAQFVELGEATGHRAGAEKEVASLQHQLAAAARSAGTASSGRSYFVELDTTLYTATSKTLIGAIFKMLGMVNVADAAGHAGGYPQLSAEYLVRADPDYVFLADGQAPAAFAHRPGFSVIRAVQRHHVFVLSESDASQWGTLVVPLLRTIAGDVERGATRPG